MYQQLTTHTTATYHGHLKEYFQVSCPCKEIKRQICFMGNIDKKIQLLLQQKSVQLQF